MMYSKSRHLCIAIISCFSTTIVRFIKNVTFPFPMTCSPREVQCHAGCLLRCNGRTILLMYRLLHAGFISALRWSGFKIPIKLLVKTPSVTPLCGSTAVNALSTEIHTGTYCTLNSSPKS